MDETPTYSALLRAESMLVAGRDEEAERLLVALADDLATYVESSCETTDEVQWFSFPTPFELLAYKRIEGDPREIRDVGEPIDRVYAELALAEIRLGDYENAASALKLAIRWNPVECSYRLDLAELMRISGDMEEYLALSFSVLERASKPEHLVRAYLNFAGHFASQKSTRAQASCLKCAARLDSGDEALQASIDQVAGTDADPEAITDDEMASILAEEGLPAGANVEVAICLLMSATTTAASGDSALATELTVRARDLVGSAAASSLIELIHASADEVDA